MTLSNQNRARLASVSVSDVSDAMEGLGLCRTAISGFNCATGDRKSVVGSALTVRQVAKHHTSSASERLTRHGDVSRSLAHEGDFVVVDACARIDIASWGANHSERCKRRGAVGVLINGSTRDIAEIQRMDFPIFYLGRSPISSRWDQETAEINGPVVISGIQIRAGDIIVGDADGLIVIAPEHLDAVIAALS